MTSNGWSRHFAGNLQVGETVTKKIMNLSSSFLFRSLAAVMAVAFCTSACAQAATTATATGWLEQPIVSSHSALLGGDQRIEYTAVFDEVPLRGPGGDIQATITSTSYLRAHVQVQASRPVMFLFNGGPGASSSPLHFGALGPRRFVSDSPGAAKLADNSASLLDAADLVFIDPVGTGFSQALADSGNGPYWSLEGDAKAVAVLIRDWLARNHRESSPIYIVGESYGGFRAGMLLREIPDIKISGLVLVSPLLDLTASTSAPGNDLPYVFNVPSMAVAAWSHGRIDKTAHGGTESEVFESARKFAEGEYASALMQGSRLSETESARVAQDLSSFIGLPAKVLEKGHLRIESEEFLNILPSDPTLRVGRLDTRVTGLKKPAAVGKPSNDPALPSGGASSRIETYMSNELGVKTGRRYLSLNFDVNAHWDWRLPAGKPSSFYTNAAGYIGEAMRRQPSMRLLATGSYYDMAIPLLAVTYALDHSGVPADRMRVISFVSDHSPYDDEVNRQRFSAAVRSFLQQ
jgi:carboxypeptidase C (cathepsin A)